MLQKLNLLGGVIIEAIVHEFQLALFLSLLLGRADPQKLVLLEEPLDLLVIFSLLSEQLLLQLADFVVELFDVVAELSDLGLRDLDLQVCGPLEVLEVLVGLAFDLACEPDELTLALSVVLLHESCEFLELGSELLDFELVVGSDLEYLLHLVFVLGLPEVGISLALTGELDELLVLVLEHAVFLKEGLNVVVAGDDLMGALLHLLGLLVQKLVLDFEVGAAVLEKVQLLYDGARLESFRRVPD